MCQPVVPGTTRAVVARGCDHRVGRTPRDRCRRCPTTYPRLAPERCAARQFRRQTTATRAIGPRSVRRMGQGDKAGTSLYSGLYGVMYSACMADEGGCAAAGRRSVTVTTESRAPSSPVVLEFHGRWAATVIGAVLPRSVRNLFGRSAKPGSAQHFCNDFGLPPRGVCGPPAMSAALPGAGTCAPRS